MYGYGRCGSCYRREFYPKGLRQGVTSAQQLDPITVERLVAGDCPIGNYVTGIEMRTESNRKDVAA